MYKIYYCADFVIEIIFFKKHVYLDVAWTFKIKVMGWYIYIYAVFKEQLQEMFRHVNSNLSPLIQQQASGVSQTVVNNVNNEQLDLNQTFFDRSLQRIQHVLGYLGFEYFNNDQPDGQDVVERERAEQLGNQQVMAAGNGFMVAEEGAGDFDVVDRFYMIFRFLFFIGICFAYSSLDKAIIVVFLVLYVYLWVLIHFFVIHLFGL